MKQDSNSRKPIFVDEIVLVIRFTNDYVIVVIVQRSRSWFFWIEKENIIKRRKKITNREEEPSSKDKILKTKGYIINN